jgi:cytosine/adenosine deaminase-related metal-dependent hydrolase
MPAEHRHSSGAELETCDILVRNGYVISMDAERRIFVPGAVAITGSRISAVGPECELLRRYRGRRVFDAGGAVVHPGFIEAHNHIVHGTCRGIFADTARSGELKVSFADWKADVTPEDEYLAAMLAGLEMLRNGFTMLIEPGSVFEPDAVAEAATLTGVRTLLAGCYLWDQVEVMRHLGGLESKMLYDRAPPRLERCLDELGSQLNRNRELEALARGYVAVYGLGTASDALLRAAKRVADEAGVAFHQHEGYHPAASQADRERLGRSRIVHLQELGVLGPNATLVHMAVLDEEEIAPIKESGTSIVWCPLAFQKTGISDKARCRHPELHRDGINVALGTDGALECTIGDAALSAFHLAASMRTPVTPAMLLEMQTVNAARAAGLADELGSLEPGKRADLVIRSAGAAETGPGVNPVHQLALTSRTGTVETVVVNGEVVFHGGRSTRLDEAEVRVEARRSVERRMARLGLNPSLAWPVVGTGPN